MTADDKNVVLVGMRASGKTTLGRELARRLGRPFVDLDDELARRAGRPADAVLAEDGEARFRVLEAEVLRAVAHRRGAVIATGGGAPLLTDAFAALAAHAVVVHLELPRDELVARAAARPRPPLTDRPPAEEVDRLLARRRPVYHAVADITLRADGPDPILDLLHRLPFGTAG